MANILNTKRFLFAALFFVGFAASPAHAGVLNVKLVNAISKAPLANQEVTALERLAGGSLQWRGKLVTNSQGRVDFELAGLGSGRRYVLRTNPYGKVVESNVLTQTGFFQFQVGRLQVHVKNGLTGRPWKHVVVRIKIQAANGALSLLMSATTDTAGLLRLDPADLGVKTLVLEANSPTDGSVKRSGPITRAGQYEFVVGNSPLNLILANAISGALLAGKTVLAYERLDDDSLVWTAARTTDPNGLARFDLDGLANGGQYVFRANPYGKWVTSKVATRPGWLPFEVGGLEATVIRGDTRNPMKNTQVRVKTQDAGGTWSVRVMSAITDKNGVLRLDPPGLGSGQPFVLEADSPVDGGVKRSQLITTIGKYTFVVGNKPLQVKLVNAISKAPLASQEVTALERLAGGSLQWRGKLVTNSQGRVDFDLDGLGSGRKYVLRTEPYGSPVASPVLTKPGLFRFEVGAVPVTLIDDDRNKKMSGQQLAAIEKRSSGELVWCAQNVTNINGRVHFDLPGLDEGKTYVIRGANPFGKGEVYFSDLVTKKGPVEFRISRNGPTKLDREPPTIGFRAPAAGARVSSAGFTVRGYADDDVGVTKVTVVVDDPLRGSNNVPANYDAISSFWLATVPANVLSVGKTVKLTARAQDAKLNAGDTSRQVNVVADLQAPQIQITSHKQGDAVSDLGFLLLGSVSDDTEVEELRVKITDGNRGVVVNNGKIALAADGRWARSVRRYQVSADAALTIELTATDRAGHETAETIQLNGVGGDALVHRLVKRITFGATPELLARLAVGRLDDFLYEQLNPDSIDDSAFEALIAGFKPQTKRDLQVYQLLHAIHSRRQLREVLSWFWENHFSTDLHSHGRVDYELAENNAFRANALGNFRDLLEISAKSPAMLYYLSGFKNRAREPNENYARELMELHTMGIKGGYTQADVEEVARAFTGWTVVEDSFHFDPLEHDTKEKFVLGHTLAAGRGIEDGEDVLDILAEHPATAQFICLKLSTLLVNDTPPGDLIDYCAATFEATAGTPSQIARVVETILTSSEFTAQRNYASKIKTPLEFAAGLMRNLNAGGDYLKLPSVLLPMGLDLFANPVPTGYPEVGTPWINTNSLLQRFKFVNDTVFNPVRDYLIHIEPLPLLRTYAVDTAEGVAGYLFELCFGEQPTWLEWQSGLDILTSAGQSHFDLSTPDAELLLRDFLSMILTYPGYHYQ